MKMPEGGNCRHQTPASLYFAQLPFLPNLCSVVVTVPATPQIQKHAALVSPPYQPQIIKCRELIFTEPDILATPVLGQLRKLQIILSRDLFKTGRLQARLQKMGLQIDRPKIVNTADFQACLRYTMLAKLAPAWNKVGDLLVQGRDFVTSTTKMQAVNMELSVTETELYLTMEAHVIRVPPIALQDLDVCMPVLRQFLNERPHSIVEEYSVGNKWCHILPSMKKGKIINVLHQIPADSPFRTYKDIKRYWKNTYGYRLPENDDNMLYYQVYFKPVGETLFTYPECCVRSQDVFSFARVNQAPILEAFLQDVQSKIPRVCSQKFELNARRAYYTHPSLLDIHQLSQQNGASKANLTTTAAPVTVSYRPFSSQQSPALATTPNNATPDRTVQPASQIGRPCAVANTPPAMKPVPSSEIAGVSSITAQQGQPIIPQFAPTFNKSQVAARKVQAFTRQSQMPSAAQAKVPIFRAKHRPVGQNSCPVSNSGLKFGRSNPGTTVGSADFILQPREAAKAPSHFPLAGSEHLAASTKPDPVCKPNRLGARSHLQVSNTFREYSTVSIDDGVISASEFPAWSPLGSQPNSAAPLRSSSDHSSLQSHHWGPAALQQLSPASTTSQGSSTSTRCGTWTGSWSMQPMQPNIAKKRKLGGEENKPKKVRAKPKLQDGINIEELAMQNQLDKVNTVTLQFWLKERGLPCRSKDKKTDLISRIQQALNMGPT